MERLSSIVERFSVRWKERVRASIVERFSVRASIVEG